VLCRLDGCRWGAHTRNAAEVVVWDTKTGRRVEGKLSVANAPTAKSVYLSPNGRFLVVSQSALPTPRLVVTDTTTSKTILDATWTGGAVHFTADSARVLVAEQSGRCRWFRLPSGEADGEWVLAKPEMGIAHEITS